MYCEEYNEEISRFESNMCPRCVDTLRAKLEEVRGALRGCIEYCDHINLPGNWYIMASAIPPDPSLALPYVSIDDIRHELLERAKALDRMVSAADSAGLAYQHIIATTAEE